jgi:hypothetical protein
MAAAQLDLVEDTELRDDLRLARKTSHVRQPSPVPRPASGNITCSSTVHPEIAIIARTLKTEQRPLMAFLRFAGVPYITWYPLARGEVQPSGRTLKRLKAAMQGAPLQAKQPAVIAAFHRLVMVLLADAQGLDRTAVLATDFSVQRPQNAAWRAASEVRMFAVYITAVELCVENVDVAAALSISRQAVKKARDRVEDLREQPAIDSLIDRVAAMAAGR